MPITVAELRAIITADDTQYQQRMAAVLATSQMAQQQATRMVSSFDSLGPSLLKAGAAMTAVGAAFGFLIKAGSELQTALVHVAGNTSMSAAEFDNLQKSVVQLGLKTPVAMDEIGRSYMQAANFGFHFAEANMVVEAALKSAVATGASAEQTVRALAIAMHQFNIPASEAAQTMDVLHLAAARGGQTLEQFTAVTGRVFSVARAMGISLVDVSAALSALTSSGLSAAQSATLLQGAIVKIANPAKNAQAEVARLSKATGIDLVGDFSKAGLSAKGLSGVMEDIGKAVGNDTAEILKLVPALRGGIGVILLTSTASKDYKDRLLELNDVMAGKLKPTQQDFERTMKTLGAQTAILGNSFQALGFELVKALGPSLVGSLETLNRILPQTVLFIGQLPPAILAAGAAFVTTIGIVGTVSVALGALALLLGGPVTAAIVGLGIAVGALAAVVALNFGRITQIASTGSGAISINFIEIAGKAGAVADAFQILARLAIFSFDFIVTGAVLMAQGVKSAFDTVKDAGKAALALVTNDMVGFAVAMSSMATTSLDSAKAIGQTMKGMIERGIGDMKDISAHAGGQFAAMFTLAAINAGESFAKASAQQHQLFEDAGLKLVNAYMVGVLKAKPMNAAMWHSMTDDARASFTDTAQAWIQSNTALDDAIDSANTKRNKTGRDAAKEAAKILDEVLKEQLASVNDWLKATGRDIDISNATWKLVPEATRQAFIAQSLEFHKSIEEANAWKAAQLAAALVTGEAFAPALHLVLDAVGDLAPAFKELEGTEDAAFRVMEAGRPAAADMSASLIMLKAAVKNLREDIASSPIFDAIKIKDEAAKAFEGVVQMLERQGELLGETQDQINARILTTMAKMRGTLPPEMLAIFDLVVANAKRSMDRLPGALDEIFNKLLLGAKHQMSGIIQIIDNLPGAFGDSLRKSTNVVTKWINQIDGVLKGLHKIFASIPDGVAGAISSVIGLFKHTTAAAAQATTASEDWAGSLEKLSNGTQVWSEKMDGQMDKVVSAAQQGASKVISAIAAMMAGVAMIISGHAAGGLGGAIQGALGGFLTGATIGAFFGPTGALVGGIIGAVGGFIAGIVGGSKSAAQKASDALQLEQLKANVAATVQQTVNAVIDGMKSALELFDKLADFTVIPYKNITRFFNQLDFLLQKFVELSKVFGSGMLDAAKALADQIGPILDVIRNGVGAFESLGGFTGIAEVSVNSFSAAMTNILQAFIAIKDKFLNADGAIDATVKQAAKFANKVGQIIDVIKTSLDAFTGFATFKNILPATLDAFGAALELAVIKMGDIASRVDNGMLKAAQRFSDKALSVVALIKDALDAFVPLTTFAAIPVEAFDALFAGITIAVTKMQDLAGTLDTELLTRAVSVADKAQSIFSAIKSGVDALTSLVDFKAVAPESFQALLDGFNQAIVILTQMFDLASLFETIAINIESKLKSAARHLSDGVISITDVLRITIAALSQVVALAGGGVPGGTTDGLASGTSSGAPLPSGLSARASGGSSAPTIIVNVYGSLIHESRVQDVVMKAIVALDRRGRVATI